MFCKERSWLVIHNMMTQSLRNILLANLFCGKKIHKFRNINRMKNIMNYFFNHRI